MSSQPVKSRSYGQYCPLALATELLCRRWTVLIVSRLLDGCNTFTSIHQGVPRISPTLLSTRLSELEHAGLVNRRKVRGKDRYVYELTEAGRELDDIVDQLAVWGQHWARDNETDDLDIEFLAWSVSLRIDTRAMPPGQTVMEFEFSGVSREFKRFWLVSSDGSIDMCIKHPGLETDLLIKADIRRFVETWRGFRNLRDEIRTSHIILSGPNELVKAFPDWLKLSALAPYKRKRKGRESLISSRNRGR